MTEVIPVYLGEAMLVRWSDNHRGRTVTFQLEMEAGENPFRGYKCGDSGQRVKLCAVLVGDDEEPVSAKTAAPQVGTTGEKGSEAKSKKDYTRSQIAALKGHDPQFREWLYATASMHHEQEDGPEYVRVELCQRLGIKSRSELDTPGPAQKAFDRLLATYDNRDFIR